MHISVYGAGSWGTALAIVLARQGRPVTLWARQAQYAHLMQSQRENHARLPGFPLPEAVSVIADFEAAAQADWHIIATPMSALRETARRLSGYQPQRVLWLCKGLEADSESLPHQVLQQVLPGVTCGALSGPSFAQEAAQGLPFALVCASENVAFARHAAETLHGGNMRVYSSGDVVGVEIAGAVKNVMAIATGIADGLKLGMNARAALITRGLAEMTRLGLALGARAETFMGLAGVGDLLLTCTGDLSRNRRVGLALARGEVLTDITAQLGAVAEGVKSAPSIDQLARRTGVEMPITRAVCAVLFERLPAQEALQQLLSRQVRSE
ncbi:MAG: NAD(P)-dependent glycerol-3-phosphate dehydrogenase [Burkholderiales bacterium]|jgi:glycerol-3-phosphate dehydrogenase (NAD(P)+)|nr:NAD(P)-dependent glycerol-3-phosphate dehydrogenase [Burkholderiales bacterium]MCA3154176.1 NAD(P)-dependent glycerol-3-phosphate dehydrogenase [Burkholderiales bacterium]MCA3156633.1 NAD(P)-dependent glycerol-3-phosphate dehydrogenase [Burkholderiales bacterium]MCA3158398.1 NAD(P)-dependent glycerol-3-phosphate dehydrogenase [Burkholderiales bacterium]MCA3161779.1 NAD(P)-dependent glycerol-3-phosphate dehydrogenase [Burkholderiales bacterium]